MGGKNIQMFHTEIYLPTASFQRSEAPCRIPQLHAATGVEHGGVVTRKSEALIIPALPGTSATNISNHPTTSILPSKS